MFKPEIHSLTGNIHDFLRDNDVFKNFIGLADANNFYASCERVFTPKAQKLPVIVLSNNDGI